MKAANGGIDWRRAEKLSRVLQRVDQAGVAATRQQHQTLVSVEHQAT